LLDAAVTLPDDAGKGGRASEGKDGIAMARRRYQNGCVFKRGRNWVLRYREDIRQTDGALTRVHRSIVLGPFGCKKEARQAAENHLCELNVGTARPQAAITFGDFWHRYFALEVLSKRKFATREVYGYLARAHLLPFFGGQRLCDITRFEVQAFISQKQRHGYAPKTLAHLRSLLSKIFGVAVFWGWMNGNPASGIELPPMEKRRQARVLSLKEIARLSQSLSEPVRAVFVLGLLTGLRIGEILALRVEDVDLSVGSVCVRRNVYRGRVQEAPKTPQSERQIPLASLALAAVQRWLGRRPEGSSWLFPSEAGTPYHDRNLLRRELWPVCDALGIPHFGWHSLRHSFTTYGGNNGVPMPVLQSVLGHVSAETTMIYAHPLEEAQRQAVEKLAGVLFPIVPAAGAFGDGSGELIQ